MRRGGPKPKITDAMLKRMLKRHALYKRLSPKAQCKLYDLSDRQYRKYVNGEALTYEQSEAMR